MASIINPDEYRVNGEKEALFIGFAVLAFCFLLLAGLSFGLLILGVLIVGALVWIKQGQQLGQMVKVSRHQFDAVYSLGTVAAQRLAMAYQPVYIYYLGGRYRAYAIGFLRQRSVVISNAIVDKMAPKEMQFIIGRELSHIKCGHTDVMVLTEPGVELLDWLGSILGLFFNRWSQKAEYTCDRGGLLACRDLESAVAAICKRTVGPELFKKLNIDKFLEQIDELEKDDVSRISEFFGTDPYLVRRIKSLQDFWHSDLYKRLAAKAP